MTPDVLDSVLTDASRLRRRFASTAPQPWTAATAAAELTVQLGHLALCLLRRREAGAAGLADPQRPITNIGDELADVLLATLSVTTLAGVNPDPRPVPRPARCDSEVDAFLLLLAVTGQLAEAAMVGEGYRHQPAGTPPSVQAAGTAAIVACEVLVGHFGLDLVAEFRVMVTDAEAFLDAMGQLR